MLNALFPFGHMLGRSLAHRQQLRCEVGNHEDQGGGGGYSRDEGVERGRIS